ncbi:chaperone protein ClpB [Trichonephila clavata]|uniref:Chaperone protein ClpB n=1 Tax=Trichonephila clavata TaxID=2740835 RepID=A0A8X6HS05_TRICU|nr:chaperone protein ClpB [Trichonephila clavata]
MLEDESGLVQDLINACGGSVQSISDAVDSAIKKLPVIEGPGSGGLQLSREIAKVFEDSIVLQREIKIHLLLLSIYCRASLHKKMIL